MNKKLFKSSSAAPADTKNAAGGIAYAMPPAEALAQLACTSFFGNTFYVSAETQLKDVINLAAKCDDVFVAQVSRYSRKAGYLKDAPAVLLAYLYGKKSPEFTEALFNEVIDNVKMLSNFVMALRSSQFGRRSLGTVGSKLIDRWLASRSLDYLWRQSIAKDPSLGDIIKLAHARPQISATDKTEDKARAALYRMLIGKELAPDQFGLLPELVRATLEFRAAMTADAAACQLALPVVPFNMLDSLPLRVEHWLQLFENGGYMFTRMNLATALRQQVFKDPEAVKLVAAKLADAEQVIAARQFPYQILQARQAALRDPEMPTAIRMALHAAMEAATASCPAIPGRIIVAVDCSGSMSSPATGARGDATSTATYADIAALFAACVLRKNPDTRVMTFATEASYVAVDPADTVMTTAEKLAKAGGGTDTSAPLRKLAYEQTEFDLFILISDNEGWRDSSDGGRPGSVSAWDKCKAVNPNARQVRINISPNATDQLPKRDDTLRVGGFSDAVFAAIQNWAEKKDWVASVREFGR